ncbi:helix-turn-helix transcriptional regulator [bacterium]|nr:helix-turn-helix transcriptional regulator [bacterium]
MQLILNQILSCPYQGIVKRLYFESKILELIALQLLELRETSQPSTSTIKLNPEDINCLHEAKAILLRRLEAPPSLTELARQVGLNARKLKQGFRQVFGTTVFGYLRDRRLEQAKQLIATGQIKVKDAAHSVGYASPASFNAAFRQKFGINPRDCVPRSPQKVRLEEEKSPVLISDPLATPRLFL